MAVLALATRSLAEDATVRRISFLNNSEDFCPGVFFSFFYNCEDGQFNFCKVTILPTDVREMKPRSYFEKGRESLQLDTIILIDSIKTTGVNTFEYQIILPR